MAAALGSLAEVLRAQGRYAEAYAAYDEAARFSQLVGDKRIEAITLQHQGHLANDWGQPARAIPLFHRALRFFQDAHDEAAFMQTCNALGVSEQNVGRLAEARAWYNRAQEIAVRRNDRTALADAAQNIGVV